MSSSTLIPLSSRYCARGFILPRSYHRIPLHGGAQSMAFDPRSELAPTGTLRVGINFGNVLLAATDSTRSPRGIAVDMARELAHRMHVPMEIVGYESAGRMAGGAKAGAWDVAFLATDP